MLDVIDLLASSTKNRFPLLNRVFFYFPPMSTQMPKSQFGDPTWEIATLFPTQGEWSELEYLNLDTNRLIEYSHGTLEVLAMPTELHQLVVFYLCSQICNLRDGQPPGVALLAPFRVKLFSGKFREPDVVFMLHENRKRRKEQFWEGADLAMEIVSDDDPNREYITKRAEYAQARIFEYWIVDPRDRTIRVLNLHDDSAEYRESGCYADGQIANSILLPDLKMAVTEVFDQQC